MVSIKLSSLLSVAFILLGQLVPVISKKKDMYIYGYDKFPESLPTVELTSNVEQVRTYIVSILNMLFKLILRLQN